MESIRLLSPDQARDLTKIADQGWKGLSNFVGHEVTRDATAMQFLDEWIDRHMKKSPDPSKKVRLLWATVLGDIFRRRHDGRWAMKANGKGLAVVCPTENGGRHTIDVSSQIDRRIDQGMAESLTYFYNMTRIALKMGQ